MVDRSDKNGLPGTPKPSACCVPQVERSGKKPAPVTQRAVAAPEDAVAIPGGRADLGTDAPILTRDGESPRRDVPIKPFLIDVCAVTNDRFEGFVADTGYITEAERFGWSFVFFQLVPDDVATAAVVDAKWWRCVDGADWRHPDGPWSDLSGRGDWPVVHVSWNDAVAFAAWAGGQLPTEAQWEHAARGGLRNKRFPWGDKEPDDTDFFPCNIWQGRFPTDNTEADGHVFLAPSKSFAPNGYGLFNSVGNCWEWTSDAMRIKSLSRAAKARNAQAKSEGHKALKGGSYLCHVSYCYRYRIAARIGNPADTTTGHIGFRCVYDVQSP